MLTESCPVRIQDPEWICHGLFWCLQVEYCPGCLNKKWDKKIHKFVFNFKFPHELLKFSSVTSDLLAELLWLSSSANESRCCSAQLVYAYLYMVFIKNDKIYSLWNTESEPKFVRYRINSLNFTLYTLILYIIGRYIYLFSLLRDV